MANCEIRIQDGKKSSVEFDMKLRWQKLGKFECNGRLSDQELEDEVEVDDDKFASRQNSAEEQAEQRFRCTSWRHCRG